MNLRLASGSVDFPYRSSISTFVRLAADGGITQENTVDGKRAILRDLDEGDRLLAVWTGRYRSDVFEVDDLERAREALA